MEVDIFLQGFCKELEIKIEDITHLAPIFIFDFVYNVWKLSENKRLYCWTSSMNLNIFFILCHDW